MKYKELWEQMCQRCDELEAKLANQEQPPIGFITNARHRLNFEPNATGLKDMPKTIDWKIPVYGSPQPKREWVGLTDEQIRKASLEAGMQEHYMGFHSGFIRFARAIEDAHGIKGETK